MSVIRDRFSYLDRETHKTLVRGYTTADGNGSTTEYVSQEELASVKAEMERRVDQLHSQLHYRQNVTVGILKNHCSSTNTGNSTLPFSHNYDAFKLKVGAIRHLRARPNESLERREDCLPAARTEGRIG